MSDSSKPIETNDPLQSTDNIEEPLDPRIQIELERANAATSDINNLETQLDNAQKLFQLSFTSYKQRLANLAKNSSRSIERARPFHLACQQAAEAQLDTQQAAHEYQYSVEFHHTAQENLSLAQSQLSQSDDSTWQEYVRHAAAKITQAEQDKRRCEQIHEEKSKRYQEFEQQRLSLSRSLKRAITKSKPYFDIKRRAEDELKKQKLRIEDVQKAIRQAKTAYRTALKNLEEISEEIHVKRQTHGMIKLPMREPAVGSEHPDQYVELSNLESSEFFQINLSDDSSDTETSTPIHSLSINDLSGMSMQDATATSNSMPRSLTNLAVSNRFSSLISNSSADPLSNQNHADVHQQRKLIASKRLSKNAPMPLLASLSRLHPCASDSSLNFRPQP